MFISFQSEINSLRTELSKVLNYQGKSLTIGQWQVLFDGEKLSISEAPHRNVDQLSLFERS